MGRTAFFVDIFALVYGYDYLPLDCHPLGNLGDVLALKAGDGQFVLAGLPGTISARQRRSAVRATAGNFGHVKQSSFRIGHTDDDHALMQEGAVKAGDRGLLATVLARSAGEDAADLADQAAAHPQAASLVQEVAHLRAHVAE